MWIIYKHTNLINGKIYIGQTCQKPEKRWDYGCGYKKHNLHFYNAIKKYGWKSGFSHEIIETNILTQKEANEKETYWIQYYNSKEPNGYNQNNGGLSQSGYHMTEDTKKKIGKKNGKLVRCLETNEIFYSTMEAGRQLNINGKHIADVCNQKRLETYGLHWEYLHKPLPGNTLNEKIQYLENLRHQRKSKPIKCIELNQIFSSGLDAEKELNICRSNISQCCTGKRKIAGGYHWEFYKGE